MTTPCIIEKRRAAQALRASKKAARVEAADIAAAAKKGQAADREETKRLKTIQLKQEKLLKEQTQQARQANLKADKDRIKATKGKLTADKQALRDKKLRNANLRALVDAKRREVAGLLSSKETDAVRTHVNAIQKGSGLQRQTAIDNLGRLIAKVRGVELIPGSNPWETLWQANVLFSGSTNASNVVGNVTSPFIQVARDVGRGDVRKASRFTRQWLRQILSFQTLRDIKSGFFGELGSRLSDIETPTDLKDLASGIKIAKETDAVRIIANKFGTGLINRVVFAYQGLSLRAIGAMDAVFSRAAIQARLAREAPSYREFLDDRLQANTTNRITAENEKAEFERIGATVPRDYVNRRTTELTFLQKPQDVQDRVLKASRKDVFQAKGATGFVGKLFKAVLEGAGNAGIPYGPEYVNSSHQTRWARAIARKQRVARDDATLDEVYPVVMRGLAEGRSVQINGQPVRGNTNQLLGEILEALQKKQLISLNGGSWKPLKFVVGMFVNTGSQILDIGVETIPLIGKWDKKNFGAGIFSEKLQGSWHEFTQEEKDQLNGLQTTSAVLTGGILMMALAGLEEKDPWLRFNGAMRDNALREFHKGRGVKPYSVEIMGKPFYYKDVPGINLIFAGIGELTDQYLVAKRTPDRPMDSWDGFAAITGGMLYAGTQLSIVKNIQVLADAFAVQEASYAETAGKIVSNVLTPFAVPYSAEVKEIERFIYGDLSKPKDLQSRLIQNIPMTKFFSDNKPMLNLFGKPVNTTILPGFSRFIGTAEDVPELNWLLQRGYSLSLPKPNAPLSENQIKKYAKLLKSDDPDDFEKVLSQKDQYRYMEVLGPDLQLEIRGLMQRHPTGWSIKVQDELDRRVRFLKTKTKNKILRGQ